MRDVEKIDLQEKIVVLAPSVFRPRALELEYDYLVQLLKSTQGNVARAARIARRNRTEFYKLLGRHALDPARFKPGAAA